MNILVVGRAEEVAIEYLEYIRNKIYKFGVRSQVKRQSETSITLIDGTRYDTFSINSGCRGKRVDLMFVDKQIDSKSVDLILRPFIRGSVIPFEHAIIYY